MLLATLVTSLLAILLVVDNNRVDRSSHEQRRARSALLVTALCFDALVVYRHVRCMLTSRS
jgi:hypothetical protein